MDEGRQHVLQEPEVLRHEVLHLERGRRRRRGSGGGGGAVVLARFREGSEDEGGWYSRMLSSGKETKFKDDLRECGEYATPLGE